MGGGCLHLALMFDFIPGLCLHMKKIEDITWPRGDTKFLFKHCVEKYFFQHEKRNFVSPSDHVMFYLYKHQ